jgi:hypothetical protein
VSTLTPHEQTDDSLSIENMVVPAKSASHTNEMLETPQVQSRTWGRPKGSTMAKKKQDELNKTKCIDAIVVEYSKKYAASQSDGGKRVERGYLKGLIDEKTKEFDIDCSVSTKTTMNRNKRGALTSLHGAKSPLEEVKLALVEICIQMGKICQPLSCMEAIALMNSMIENTQAKQQLVDFHQSRRLGTKGFEKGRVTTSWWRGFLGIMKIGLLPSKAKNLH